MAISLDNDVESVKFKSGTTNFISGLDIENGSLIYNTDNGKTYMDYNGQRIQTGGNADTMIAIGDNEPTDADIKLWIEEKNAQDYNTFNYRNSSSSNWESLKLPPTGDTLPVGAVVEYSGSTIPYGWESAGSGKIRKVQSSVGVVGVVASTYSTDNNVVYNAPYINSQTGKILWTNSNPTNTFANQTITLSGNLSNYDVYEIIYKEAADSSQICNTGKLSKNYNTRLVVGYAGNEGVNIRSRVVTIASNTSITFAEAYVGVGTDSRVVNNNLCVPLYIIGYKTGLFD